MRYCFLTFGSWKGNTRYMRLRELAAQMIPRGVSVSFLIDDLEGNDPATLDLHPDANIVRVPKPRGVGQIIARRRCVAAAKPDVVHVLNPSVKAYLALTLTSQGRYRVVGDWEEWPARRPGPAPKRMVLRFLDRWLRHRANPICLCSRYLQRAFADEFGIDAIYLPYATYLPTLAESPSPFAEPTAVYMGNFYPAYDHDLIFQAAVMMKERGLQPPIQFLGFGPEMEKWQQFVAEHQLSNIRFLGYVDGPELCRRLRHAHVLLFPFRENLLNLCRCPSKTFAYAQARRPVITNCVGEVAEVLGDRGTYVECTAQAFANAIERAFAQPALPDVDYKIERQNWAARAETLLAAIPRGR